MNDTMISLKQIRLRPVTLQDGNMGGRLAGRFYLLAGAPLPEDGEVESPSQTPAEKLVPANVFLLKPPKASPWETGAFGLLAAVATATILGGLIGMGGLVHGWAKVVEYVSRLIS